MRVHLLLAFAALLAVAGASEAQTEATLTVTPEAPMGLLPPGGSLDMNVTVEMPCQFLTGGGSSTVLVMADGLPNGTSSGELSLSFNGQDCVMGATTTLSETGALTLFAEADAMGLEPLTGTVMAAGSNAVGGTATGEAALPEGIMVDYMPGHTISEGDGAMFTVDGETYAFNLTLEVQANAKTMIMFENKQVDPGAKLDGLKAVTFDVAAGERSSVLALTFTPPPGAWDQVNVTFYNFSHCIGGPDCGNTMEQNVTWTFVNANPGTPSGEEPESEDSPGVGFVAVAVAAVAVAAIARRRA